MTMKTLELGRFLALSLKRYSYIQTYIHTYIHNRDDQDGCPFNKACIHTYLHTFIYAYIHAYIHTYIDR